MSTDPRTPAAYEAHARDYDNRFRRDRPDRHLQAFIGLLPAGARVLDLGCGILARAAGGGQAVVDRPRPPA